MSGPALNRTIGKIVLTVAIGGLTFLLTNLTDQPQSWALVLSVLIGGIVLLVQFLIDFEQAQQRTEVRLERLEDGLPRAVEKEIAKVSDATRLRDQLERSGFATESVRRLVTLSASLVDRPVRSLAYRLAEAEIADAVHLTEVLSHGGEVTYDGEDRDWLRALTRNAVRSIDATSRVSGDGNRFVDEGFWDSELSLRYLQWQREAAARQVVIRRIFIAPNRAITEHPDFRRMCRQQLEIGIVVRVLDTSELSAERALTAPGFVLFDGEVSYELFSGGRSASGGVPYYVRTRIQVDAPTVRDRVHLFNEYWNLSTHYS